MTCPVHHRLQPAADGFDLGQFGHRGLSGGWRAQMGQCTASRGRRTCADEGVRRDVIYGRPSRGRPDDDDDQDDPFRLSDRAARPRRPGWCMASSPASPRKYDVMNDLMSGGVHRLWKDAMMDWLAPRPGQRLLDVAGGTGDVAFRFLKRAPGATATVLRHDRVDAGRRAQARRGRTAGRPAGLGRGRCDGAALCRRHL